MKRTFTCVLCPNGCDIEAELENGQVLGVEGNLCPKGKEYVTQEVVDPRRTIATSVPIEGGEIPLVSVRVTQPIPKGRIFDVMKAINQVRLQAPVHIGQVILPNVLGLESDVIITKEVKSVQGQ